LAGKLTVVAGLLTITAAWLPAAWAVTVFVLSVALASLIPVFYSFVLFKRMAHS
jgi:hypothetical protein